MTHLYHKRELIRKLAKCRVYIIPLGEVRACQEGSTVRANGKWAVHVEFDDGLLYNQNKWQPDERTARGVAEQVADKITKVKPA